MRVIAGVDQLRVYPHLVAGALHTALHYVGHAYLVTNLAEVTRDAALILHDGSATDDFQVCDPRQMRKDFVLHPIREEGVLFITAQILERQNSDRAIPDCQGVRMLKPPASQRNSYYRQHQKGLDHESAPAPYARFRIEARIASMQRR